MCKFYCSRQDASNFNSFYVEDLKDGLKFLKELHQVAIVYSGCQEILDQIGQLSSGSDSESFHL